MKIKLITTIVSSLAVLGIVTILMPVSVIAGPFSGSQGQVCGGVALTGPTPCDSTGATSRLNNVLADAINILSVIAGIISIIFIIIAGMRFTTSGGDANKVAAARSAALYAIIGIVVVAVSQIVVKYVLIRFVS